MFFTKAKPIEAEVVRGWLGKYTLLHLMPHI